jgi:hypothetical protein
VAQIKWDDTAFRAECEDVTMDRLFTCAKVIAADAKRILAGKLKGDWREHGPYGGYLPGRRSIRLGKKPVPYEYGSGASWTARYHGAMVDTIRAVRKKDSASRNVWIMAGNFNVWWALQLEFGRGAWKGKAKPFLRPALNGASSSCRGILEGGAIGSEEV